MLLTIVIGTIGVYLSIYVIYMSVIIAARLLVVPPPSIGAHPRTRFGVLIPAHNEELLLPKLLDAIRYQDYPRHMYTAIVIADNCNDNTAECAQDAGAIVLERRDETSKGKGQAIKWAIDAFDMGDYDAFLIVDADSVMKSEALRNLDIVVQSGARVIQCYNGLINPNDSWFTRLLDVSRTINNELYHPGKQRLGLSSYLMGNGMCFTTDILKKYGWDAFTVGEDWEYYAKLLIQGETVAFAGDVRIYHRESESLKQATSQRMRWSSGRFAIAAKYGSNLLLSGFREGSVVKADAALPLLFPNPSLGANITLVGLGLSVALPVPGAEALTWWFVGLCVVQSGMFMAGVMFTRDRFMKMASIVLAPVFLMWKLAIDVMSAGGMGPKKWVRTERKL